MKTVRKKYLFQNAGKRCTLLVPEFLFPELERLLRKYGNMKVILPYLLEKFYKNHTRMIMSNDIGVTLKYQDEGLKLKRTDFRPLQEDWAKLKILAGSHNLSMCAFFVLLLMLEDAGALEENLNIGGVPPILPKLILHQSISLYSIPEFKRLLHMRV